MATRLPDSPSLHPAVMLASRFAVQKVPRLGSIVHSYCRECAEANRRDSRLFSHSHHPGHSRTICWAPAAMTQLSRHQLAGICLHEYGHHLAGPKRGKSEFEAEKAADLAVYSHFNVEIEYRGSKLIQWVNLDKLV